MGAKRELNAAKWNPKWAPMGTKGCQNDAKIVREALKWSLGRNVYFLEDFGSILGSLLAPKIYKFRIKSTQNDEKQGPVGVPEKIRIL